MRDARHPAMVSLPGPSIDEAKRRLVDLADGRITPEEAAAWAGQWVNDVDNLVKDPVVWDALDALAGAAIEVAPGEPLHGDMDFRHWLEEFDNALRQ
jgi:hypothetical protein